uniref:transglycosylase domain-containing protein n=1 Tax=Nonomuraea bangladeshensis TaxID=404385 RepID=UPI003F4943D4
MTLIDELDLKARELEEPPLAQKSTVLDANGRQIAQFYDTYRVIVPLDKVSRIMQEAILAIEDYRFYQHGPIDIEGTFRALAKNFMSDSVSQGGSSITQQYVKQVLLNKAESKAEQAKALEASYARKLNELRYAMGVERKYSKDQILEKYLNIAYFGDGANGIEAAAKRFFGVPAAQLDLAQAATLAGAVQDPNVTSPGAGRKARARLLARRNVVIGRMLELRKITPEQAAEARAKPLGYKGTEVLRGGCSVSPYPFFCMYVREDLLTNPAFKALGKTRSAREKYLDSAGLTIKTTINPKMQEAAEEAIKAKVYPTDYPVASQALVEPGTGEVKALATSRKFGDNKRKKETFLNFAADKLHGGATGFQAGSTFKVFTLLTALNKGYKINDGFNAPGGYRAPGYSSFKDCKGGTRGDPTHIVTNDEGDAGFLTLRTGTEQSVNTFFVMLQQRVGLCDVVKTAKALGIKRSDGLPLQEVETFTLGVNEMAPVTVATAYAAIAARGKYCAPMAVTSITDRNGKTTSYEPQCRQAIDEGVADAATDILSGVFTRGTMSGVGGIGRPAAGKTGTADNSYTAWFAGFTPDLASAVSLGDPRGPIHHPLRRVTIGGRSYATVFGADISGRIWKATMLDALKGVKKTPFHPVDSSRFGGCNSCAPKRSQADEGDAEAVDPGDGPNQGDGL